MEEQSHIIKQYLEIDTNYAVIITGNYGIGKTHFFKKILLPMISKVNIPNNDNKTYKPIHISLFGLSSITEIQSAIFTELYTVLKSTKTKLALGIFKSIARGVSELSGLGNIDDYIQDLKLETEDLLKFEELVICFDDIDRKSPSLDIKEVFGFINSLVENQGAKIIIIANEEELVKDEAYSSLLKEKVVGVSIRYNPSIEDVYNEIIQERYQSKETDYYKFLVDNKEKIINAIRVNKNNLRNLIFFLEHFKIIFKPLEVLFGFNNDFSVLKSDKQQAVLEFTLAIAIEYKLGELNSTNIDSIKSLNSSITHVSIDVLFGNTPKESQPEEVQKSYVEIFKDKYFTESKYYYFESIFSYLMGQKSFNEITLKNELEKYFIIENGVVPEHELTLQKLGYLGCLNLSNMEYRSLTFKMLRYADEGLYQLKDYSTVFHYATRYNNRLNFELPKLLRRIKNGILRGIADFSFTPDLEFYLTVAENAEFRNELSEVILFAIEINEGLMKKMNETKINQLGELLDEDFDSFILQTSNYQEEIYFLPFLKQLGARRIYKAISKLTGEQIWKLANYFKRRYPQHMYEAMLVEKDFVTELIALIDNGTKKRQKATLNNIALDNLVANLRASLVNFQ